MTDQEISEQRQLLIGSYFVCEYSLESAALFNPSIVPDPDQSDLPLGALRFILSLRATGEGHISSITFREGIIYADHRIQVLPPTGFLTEPRQIPNPRYDKALFERKLFELGLTNEFTRRAMVKLGESFALEELRACLEGEINQSRVSDRSAIQGILALAQSNYEVQFQPQQRLSERVLFPATPSQRNGIEDARFVYFQNDDGTHLYYATFTAFDGKVILPELVETTDFLHFRFITLNGPAAADLRSLCSWFRNSARSSFCRITNRPKGLRGDEQKLASEAFHRLVNIEQTGFSPTGYYSSSSNFHERMGGLPCLSAKANIGITLPRRN